MCSEYRPTPLSCARSCEGREPSRSTPEGASCPDAASALWNCREGECQGCSVLIRVQDWSLCHPPLFVSSRVTSLWQVDPRGCHARLISWYLHALELQRGGGLFLKNRLCNCFAGCALVLLAVHHSFTGCASNRSTPEGATRSS